MGLLRKMTSVSTVGMVDLRSDKERTARSARQTAQALREQNRLLKQQMQADARARQSPLVMANSSEQAPRVSPTPGTTSATGRGKRTWITAAVLAFLAIVGFNKLFANSTATTASVQTSPSVSLSVAPPTLVAPKNAVPAAVATPAQKKVPQAAPPLAAPRIGSLPNMAGRILQSAQDSAQAAGFRGLSSYDYSGRRRLQINDRNWVVCGQLPLAGRVSTATPVTFYVVKVGEFC
jgi:type II secretory pathway pseudopilin PulG